MDTQISNLSMVSMALSGLIGLAIVVALYIIFRKKGAKHLPFWVGAATFVLFALVLEQVVYYFLMQTALWTSIISNVWLLAIFGGFMAGLFEETGRYFAFKTVLRKKRDNDTNALMYGAGHGGVEIIILLCSTMVINLVFSMQFNAGLSSPFGDLSTAQAMINLPWYIYLVGALERMPAVTMHIALSVLVWFAAKDKKKFLLYPLAIVLHLFIDAVAVVLARSGASVWLIEGAVIVTAIAFVFIALAVWKKNHTAQAEEAPVEVVAEEAAETEADAQA
jgi:uncharacterized membrane protein YhfC